MYTPPQFSPTDSVVFIADTDPAWDVKRIDTERETLADAAWDPSAEGNEEVGALLLGLVADFAKASDPLRKAVLEAKQGRVDARGKHPCEVYKSGATRFSLEAEISVPEDLGGGTVTIDEYLTEKATHFTIRAMGARERRAVRKLIDADPHDFEWKADALKAGLRGISNFGRIKLKKGAPSNALIEELDAAQAGLVDQIAVAILRLTSLGGHAEKKP